MIRAIIIDDEYDAISYLKLIINEFCTDINVINTANSVIEAVRKIDSDNPDLIFLDIEMPDGSGFDVLQRVHHNNFEIIFTTAYNQYAIKAFKYSALDYILKPINVEELIKAIEKVDIKRKNNIYPNLEKLFDNLKQFVPQKLTIASNKGYEYIDIRNIIRIEADRSYCFIYLSDSRKIMVSKSLCEYDTLLCNCHFFRTHHSHLINLEKVKMFVKNDGGYIEMADNSIVPISRRRKHLFLDKMNKYLISSVE